MALISFISGPLAGRRVDLAGRPMTMGRDPTTDIPLPDDTVSGHHATIRAVDGDWRIDDLGSANGTLVNGREIRQHTLREGDIVEIGASRFAFLAPVPLSTTAVPVSTGLPHPPVSAGEPGDEGVRTGHAVADLASSPEDIARVLEMRDRTGRIRSELGKVIVGQREVLDQILMCILANGHALLVGLPGMAKTLTVRTLAGVLNLRFKRVQFTPDLMPSDIIGTDVLETDADTGAKAFRFIRGPVFCNLLLADEINRTPPKTQAALLEAMQERCVTAGNETFRLEEPFFVLATQNPIEQEGTYPLPEAQLDRFMFTIWIDYPAEHEEEQIVGATTGAPPPAVESVMNREEILRLQEVVRRIPVSEHVIKYAIRLVRATRPANPDAPAVTRAYVSTGAGPRAGQYLVLAAKAMAVLDGRIHVSCNDIRKAAVPVLRHRILTNFAADSEGKTPMSLVHELLARVEEPSARDYEPVRSFASERRPDAR